jgi:hypothetical protein
VLNTTIRSNQIRGGVAEDRARIALGEHRDITLVNNNLAKEPAQIGANTPPATTRPDSLGGGIVHEHKHFIGSGGGDNIVYDTAQMKGQRDQYLGDHHVTISSDGSVRLLGEKPNPRPSGPLAEKSKVSYYDIVQDKITHTWESDLNDNGGWKVIK